MCIYIYIHTFYNVLYIYSCTQKYKFRYFWWWIYLTRRYIFTRTRYVNICIYKYIPKKYFDRSMWIGGTHIYYVYIFICIYIYIYAYHLYIIYTYIYLYIYIHIIVYIYIYIYIIPRYMWTSQPTCELPSSQQCAASASQPSMAMWKMVLMKKDPPAPRDHR